MDKKQLLRHKRCVHMPTKENTVVIFSSKNGKEFESGFTIGNQDFTVAKRQTKAEAQWFCDMLEVAFRNLIEPSYIEKLKSEENKKQARKELLSKIINLK